LRTRARVKPVAPGVAKQVERENGEHHGERGKNHHVRRIEEVAARVIQHGTPARHGCKHAKAEKTQRRLRENSAGDADGCLNQERLQNIRQQMSRQNAKVRRAERACR